MAGPAVTVALASAAAYGVADFAGGLAARRAPVLMVTAVSQLAGLLALVPAALLRGRRPGPFAALGLTLTCGLLDTAANVLFLLATRAGALSVSGVLVSLHPVVVVLLARVVLRERLSPLQLAGAGLALTAGVLLATT